MTTDTQQSEVQKEEGGTPPSLIPDAKYAFIVVATEDAFTIRPLPEDAGVSAPATMDDVYTACDTVCRNINNQQIAQQVGQALAAAAMSQARENASKPNIIVPDGVNPSKLAVER